MKKFLQFIVVLWLGGLNQSIFAALPSTLTFATSATYPPFESMNASGQLHGFDIDMAMALCKEMKVQCTIANQPWENLLLGVKVGKFDAAISAMAITELRKQQADFTNPYYATTASFVAMANQPVEISAKGLKNKVVGVQGGTTLESYMKNVYPSVQLKTYNDLPDAFLDMVAGRIDAVMGDTPVVENWLKNNDAESHKYAIMGSPIISPEYFGVGYGIAVKKGNKELVDALNKALAKIRADGTYETMVRDYFFHES